VGLLDHHRRMSAHLGQDLVPAHARVLGQMPAVLLGVGELRQAVGFGDDPAESLT
jgi:hypothetical protein